MNTKKNIEISKRITIDSDQCGGRPCISDILDLLATGLEFEDILKELPDLESEDIKAAIQYAARKVNHAVLAA